MSMETAPQNNHPVEPAVAPKMIDLATRVAEKIVDNWKIRALIKETIIRTIVELDKAREQGAVRLFFEECYDRHVSVWLTEENKLRGSNLANMGADLRAILVHYRRQIIEQLIRERELDRQMIERREKAKAAAVKANNLSRQGKSGTT